MKIKFVGPAPQVTDRGVSFDRSRPDKFIYLGAALQLAEAFDIEGEAHDIVYRPRAFEMSESQIEKMLEKYCPNLDDYVKSREDKAKALAEELRKRVGEATTISEEGRQAWLKNIDAMYEYYLQYVTNEAAYDCVLDRVAKEVREAKIKEIRFPMENHFGIVFHDLTQKLETQKPPIDAEFRVEATPEGLMAIVHLKHPA